MIEIDDKLTFGKHKGKNVTKVLGEDPHYLKWVSEHTNKEIGPVLRTFIDIYCKISPKDDLPGWDASIDDIY